MEAGRLLFGFVFAIAGAIYCSNRALKLNRNQLGWAIFGFFMPLVAVIWISILKDKHSTQNWQTNNSNTYRQPNIVNTKYNGGHNNPNNQTNNRSSFSFKNGYKSGDLYK
jgi:hypothetical protein